MTVLRNVELAEQSQRSRRADVKFKSIWYIFGELFLNFYGKKERGEIEKCDV